MRITTITDASDLENIEKKWDAFIGQFGSSPFQLSGFMKELLAAKIEVYKPFCLVFWAGDAIVGIAPLGVRGRGFRRGRFLLGRDFQPEFVFDPRYEKLCLKNALIILFDQLNCQFVDFSLCLNHSHLSVIKEIAENCGLSLESSPEAGRAIMPINKSWIQFENERRHLRREFERTERRMQETGSLQVRLLGQESFDELFKCIMQIEEVSWKKNYRSRVGLESDPVLLYILNGCRRNTNIADFNWKVALLKKAGVPVAYSLFIVYKGHAYVCKTSFDNRLRKQGAGIYINYVVVRELMNKKNTKVIDFMTDLPFSHKWATQVVAINRFRLWQKGATPILLKVLLSSKLGKVALSRLGTTSIFEKVLSSLNTF